MVYPDLATTRNCVVAALSGADLTLVNPTFDGMNLVAKEALFLGGRCCFRSTRALMSSWPAT
jgi:trehalose 6-phosphate synthase